MSRTFLARLQRDMSVTETTDASGRCRSKWRGRLPCCPGLETDGGIHCTEPQTASIASDLRPLPSFRRSRYILSCFACTHPRASQAVRVSCAAPEFQPQRLPSRQHAHRSPTLPSLGKSTSSSPSCSPPDSARPSKLCWGASRWASQASARLWPAKPLGR